MMFVVDTRPFDALKGPLDEMFGGNFELDKEYELYQSQRYTNYVFGLQLSFVREEQWKEGMVYRFGGLNHNCSRQKGAETIDVSFHVRRLLENAGFIRVMDFEEFREESKRRNTAD